MTGATSVFIAYAALKPACNGRSCGPSEFVPLYPNRLRFR